MMISPINFRASAGNVELTKPVETEAPKTEVTSVEIDSEDIELKVGEEKTITATVNPENADDKTLTWESSNTAVATVENGKITAVSEGTAEISVKSTNGKTDSIIVTVLPADKEEPKENNSNVAIIATFATLGTVAVAGIAFAIFKVISKRKGIK